MKGTRYERELNPGLLVPYPLLKIINEFFLLVIFRVYLSMLKEK